MIIDEVHLALMRRMFVRHEVFEYEYGAPAVDEKRPYGNSDVMEDLAEIFVEAKYGDRARLVRFEDSDDDGLMVISKDPNSKTVLHEGEKFMELLKAYHEQMADVIQILLGVADLPAGEYRRTDRSDALSWAKVPVD